jgi:uncharacterized protein YndB with AHSA1/START domain
MITVETTINASLEKVWDFWIKPEHIIHWYFASDDWHAPAAENDLQIGGTFKTKMASKDGAYGFDFEGIYTDLKDFERIQYKLADDRIVTITFSKIGDLVKVVETFDTESENTEERQRYGWQMILNNFKKYVEQ